MTVKDIYSSLCKEKIELLKGEIENPIMVLLVDTLSIDVSEYEDHLSDPSTFSSTDGEGTYTKEWAYAIFVKLMSATSYEILSYAQYSYILSYFKPDFFKGRVYIIQDNIRRLFPLKQEDFIADTQESDGDSITLPIYQADQFKIGGKYYYSVMGPCESCEIIVNVFTEEKEPDQTENLTTNYEYINLSDNQALDLFLDTAISDNKLNVNLCLKRYDKQVVPENLLTRVKELNAFLGKSNGKIHFITEESHSDDFIPSDELISLLKKYWGENASFRDITIYKNPNTSNETINLSQGKVVQTVIDEYHNVRSGKEYKDIFLTAPTGAGKSLLFQLPAFYLSSLGEVTIVISPLIALMKDQVNAIISQRGFSKVAYINSEISLADRQKIIMDCQAENIDILYMAPELLLSYDISYFIGKRKLGLLVIDEAHLITTWGRDFRVDYWYIGNHIRKIRTYSNQRFPMIAVTATAVYGGKNDMVFDTADSLIMNSPHFFIGKAKRDNIEFTIGNYDARDKGIDTVKIEQTTSFIREANDLGFKTLVYAPYTTQVRSIAEIVNSDGDIAVRYCGKMDPIAKEQAERAFRRNEKKVMVCTKAFGMGVDIPDIQVVYHHAPTGSLPDYVQEIGRAARKDSITGYAVINYSHNDLKYSNQLFGMSSLKLFQLKAVLKKVYDTYQNNNQRRNMLLSVDDFAYVFGAADDVGTKVKTALMMIEKDYLAKNRYNVLLARPKQLFTIVFAEVSATDYLTLKETYGKAVDRIDGQNNGKVFIQIDLNSVWSDYSYFNSISFPMLKRKYYRRELFEGIAVNPKIRIKFTVTDIDKMIRAIQDALEQLKSFLSNRNNYFLKDELINHLKKKYDGCMAQQLASFILSSYSQDEDANEAEAFLHRRKQSQEFEYYRVFNRRYEWNFAQIERVISKLFEERRTVVCRYVSKENSSPYIRIGELMEILNVGSMETKGGEAPMMFIRLNDPEIVCRDSKDPNYNNTLYTKVKDKHIDNADIINYFFTRSLTNDERWDFIEDFFLGVNNDELKEKYVGDNNPQQEDIINILSKKNVNEVSATTVEDSVVSQVLYPPRGGQYIPNDHLTIAIDGSNVTYTIGEWMEKDPVSLHKLIKDGVIDVDLSIDKPLMFAIRKKDPKYYAKILGTKKLINFSGYDKPVMAEVVMMEHPIKFYKWWNNDRDQVYLITKEKILLFDKIAKLNKNILLSKDKELINTLSRSKK